MRTEGLLIALAVLGVRAARADEIYLKSGGQLSGRIVSRTADQVEIDVGAGRIGVATSAVLRIEEGRSALHEYEERAGRLAAGDASGWLALGEWASARGLGTQAREAYQRALSASPQDARANAALGNVQVDGRWVSEEEGYRARGFVKHDGVWMTPAEHEALMRQRAAEEAEARARAQTEASVREAEARAQEAEARARQAEAEAAQTQDTVDGLPLWYGWGAGPVVWPSGPMVTQPIRRPVGRPRPVPR